MGNTDENDGTVSGTRGEMRVRVEIERQSATTSEVLVTAREGTLDYGPRDGTRHPQPHHGP